MTSIRWGRVLVLAVALEAALFVTLVPLISRLGWLSLMVLIGVGCAVFGYIAGRLVAKGLAAGAALHGLLVGGIATAIYVAINVAQPGGLAAAVSFYGAPLFITMNALRIAGSVAGALTAPKRVSRPEPAVQR